MADILENSALFKELAGLAGFPDTSTITSNPIIVALATEGPDRSELFRYTRAVLRGYIHHCLAGFSIDKLLAARELLEFWQFPTLWTIAVDEEVAFKQFLASGVLPPILASKAEEISARFERKISCDDVFVASNEKDALLGRIFDKSGYDTMMYAAKSGYLELVLWLRDNGYVMDTRVCYSAAMNGHLVVLQWARNNGYSWNYLTCSSAAKGGHLEVLKWLQENDCPWEEDTCMHAARGGHLDVLQWARANGCPWDEWTCAYAAAGGHLDVLQWARANGCPWDNYYIQLFARNNNHQHIIDWALANGYPAE